MNRVISYQSFANRKVRGTDVKQGQLLYAIKNEPTGLFFIWSYSDEAYAHKIADRVTPGDAMDRAANWRTGTRQLTPSDRTRD